MTDPEFHEPPEGLDRAKAAFRRVVLKNDNFYSFVLKLIDDAPVSTFPYFDMTPVAFEDTTNKASGLILVGFRIELSQPFETNSAYMQGSTTEYLDVPIGFAVQIRTGLY